MPEATVLSYAWLVADSKENIAAAREHLEAALTEKSLKATRFRLFGYNGPETSKEKRTWELQALLDD